jgi:hypothetical protein
VRVPSAVELSQNNEQYRGGIGIAFSEAISNPARSSGCKSPKSARFRHGGVCPSAHRLCHAGREWPNEAVRFVSVRKTFWNLAHEKHYGLIVVA